MMPSTVLASEFPPLPIWSPSSPETQLWHSVSHSSTPPTQARMFDAGMDVCDGVVLRNLGQTAVPVVGAANPLGGKFQHQLSQRTQTTLSQDPHIWGCAAPNAQAVAFAQHSPQAAHASSFLPHTALPLQNTCNGELGSYSVCGPSKETKKLRPSNPRFISQQEDRTSA